MSSPTWDEFAELALKRITASGAEYGDIRIQDSQTEQIEGEDRRIASIRDTRDIGFGVRVLYHGAWGFAASSIPSLEEVPRVADLAVEIAKGSASVALEKVRLAQESVHRDCGVPPKTTVSVFVALPAAPPFTIQQPVQVICSLLGPTNSVAPQTVSMPQ